MTAPVAKGPNFTDKRNARRLKNEGVVLVEEGDFEEGLDKLAEAAQIMERAFGALAPEIGDYYMEYGKAVLAQSKQESDILAKFAKKSDEQAPQDEEDEKAPIPEAPAPEASTPAPAPEAPSTAPAPEAPTDGSNAAPEKPEEFTVTEPIVNDAEGGDEKSDEKAPEEQMEEEQAVAEGTQLAWQLFDVARIAYANSDLKDKGLKLADAHQRLGDVAIEDNNFDMAYAEFTKAIEYLGKSVPLSDRRIGRAQQLAGLCALYASQPDAAGFHYTAAAENHNLRLEEILVQEGIVEPKPEGAEESENIEFVELEKVEALKEKLGEDHETYKECVELFQITNDLIDRVEELQEREEEEHMAKMAMIQALAAKMAQGAQGGAAPGAAGEAQVTEQTGFDAPTTSSGLVKEATNVLTVTRKKDILPPTTAAALDDASKKRPHPPAAGEEEESAKKQKLSHCTIG